MEEVLYLDTSAVNWLHRHEADGTPAPYVTGQTRIFISVFTFAELASTADRSRALSLLDFAKRLSGLTRPLALPGELLKRARMATVHGHTDMDHSISNKWDGVWNAFVEPSLLEETDYSEIRGWVKQQHDWFEQMHTNGRVAVQNHLASAGHGQVGAFAHYSKLIRLLTSEEHVLLDLVRGLAPGESPIAEEEARDLAQHSEHWRFILAAFGYSIWCRGFKKSGHGKNSCPGSIDIQQALYLAACDKFVTADKDQYKMIRQIIPFGHKMRHAIFLTNNKMANQAL